MRGTVKSGVKLTQKFDILLNFCVVKVPFLPFFPLVLPLNSHSQTANYQFFASTYYICRWITKGICLLCRNYENVFRDV